MKRLLSLLLVLALAACSQAPSEPAPATPAAPESPAAPEAPTRDNAADAPASEPADDASEAEAPAETPAADAAAGEPRTSAEGPAVTAGPAPAPAPAPAMPDPAKAPREGIDYVVLAEPQPTYASGPGFEVAEVFAYTCIHCANLQPTLDQWKPNLPGDVRFVYVPAAFGGPGDNFARGFFAAEAMGLLDKTHNATFQAFFVERKFKTGEAEEIADHYASLGADRATFLSTMQSFAVTAKLNRARQFALRTGVQSTPTVIIAGKYSAVMTGDKGPQGLVDTIEWLVQRERALAAQ